MTVYEIIMTIYYASVVVLSTSVLFEMKRWKNEDVDKELVVGLLWCLMFAPLALIGVCVYKIVKWIKKNRKRGLLK